MALIVMPFNTCALAYAGGSTTATITTSGSYNLSAYPTTTKLIINVGLTVTLVGYDSDSTQEKPQIICNGQNTLTLDHVNIGIPTASVSALTFTGIGNTLIARNKTYLKGEPGCAGIFVGTGVDLEIKGDGKLTWDGSSGGAGISGNAGSNSGSITISGTSIQVVGEGEDVVQESVEVAAVLTARC